MLSTFLGFSWGPPRDARREGCAGEGRHGQNPVRHRLGFREASAKSLKGNHGMDCFFWGHAASFPEKALREAMRLMGLLIQLLPSTSNSWL